jgi:phosphatidylglycerophosphatase A
MKHNNLSNFHPSFLISSFFGAGRFPLMPGTIGSVIGVMLFFAIAVLLRNFDATKIMIIYLIIIIFLFIVGMIASAIYVKKTGNEDPKEVIIDEVVGQMLTLFLTTSTSANIAYGKEPWIFVLIVLIGPFVFFRLFDIIKPWPISWLDNNVRSGFGIMIDDIGAGVFAAICYNFLLFQY